MQHVTQKDRHVRKKVRSAARAKTEASSASRPRQVHEDGRKGSRFESWFTHHLLPPSNHTPPRQAHTHRARPIRQQPPHKTSHSTQTISHSRISLASAARAKTEKQARPASRSKCTRTGAKVPGSSPGSLTTCSRRATQPHAPKASTHAQSTAHQAATGAQDKAQHPDHQSFTHQPRSTVHQAATGQMVVR